MPPTAAGLRFLLITLTTPSPSLLPAHGADQAFTQTQLGCLEQLRMRGQRRGRLRAREDSPGVPGAMPPPRRGWRTPWPGCRAVEEPLARAWSSARPPHATGCGEGDVAYQPARHGFGHRRSVNSGVLAWTIGRRPVQALRRSPASADHAVKAACAASTRRVRHRCLPRRCAMRRRRSPDRCGRRVRPWWRLVVATDEQPSSSVLLQILYAGRHDVISAVRLPSRASRFRSPLQRDPGKALSSPPRRWSTALVAAISAFLDGSVL